MRVIKNAITAAVEQVKESLPDEEIFDWKKHILPKVFPFLEWKDELRDRSVFLADLQAGLLGAIMVLPQGIAFALIAGLPPIYGLYTAMVVPIVAALFGSSRHMVSGPNVALSLMVSATVTKFAAPGSINYIELTLVLTFLVGIIQLAMGIGRMGKYVGFISHTVIVGFITGAAFLIITSQMKQILGIQITERASFLETWKEIVWHLGQTNFYVLAVALATLLSALFVKRISRRIPYMLVGLTVGVVVSFLLGGESVGIQFVGQMPSQLPPFRFPPLTPDRFHLLFPNAFALAILGLVQAAAISRSIAIKSGQHLDSNQEFIGEGLSNFIGSFFSCYVGAGSFSRSALNYEAGARTPMSAVFSGLILLLIVLFVAPYAAWLPLPVMSGLIVLVAWNLVDVHQIEDIQVASRQDNIILGVVFFSTLFAELDFAIYIGVLLSLFFYLKRTSTPNIAVMSPDPSHPRHKIINIIRKSLPQCPQVKIIRIDGNLYFGAIQHVAARIREYRQGPEKWLILLANGINDVDLDGAEWLANESNYWKDRKGGGMLIVGLKVVAQEVLSNSGNLKLINHENIFTSKTEAFFKLYSKLDRKICMNCPHRVFKECAKDPALPHLESEIEHHARTA